jgi:CRISPR/Cas system-associated endoribonuclease Cas2
LSCFEIECGEKELKAVVSFIEKNIDKSLDSVFLFPISKNMESSIIEIGKGRELRRVL